MNHTNCSTSDDPYHFSGGVHWICEDETGAKDSESISLQLPDSLQVKWNEILVAGILHRYIWQLSVDTVFSFDWSGVSGHSNHKTLCYALHRLVNRNMLPPECQVYILRSVNLVRKYFLFSDILLTLLTLPAQLYVLLPWETALPKVLTCIKFCVKNEIKCADAFRMLTVAYGEATLDRSNVYRRPRRCERRRACRTPEHSTTDEKINEVEKMILANRRITVREVAEDLNISIGSCHSIFINDLGMRRVAAKFVPKLLNCDQK
ncbi:hypothetical protein LAZ67_18000552 [Cordylochernes scorpioides]|uniref:N-acetylglucosaminylphosphatidylinositol deacetylase n=1 Tax=Cordylochernes scorpioides TaxID=51811 RepID=A0ABY6LEY6_9ARAC|nr:hypothetical protein LAZ67_18000552 [Cordylochernes scorpioides]